MRTIRRSWPEWVLLILAVIIACQIWRLLTDHPVSLIWHLGLVGAGVCGDILIQGVKP